MIDAWTLQTARTLRRVVALAITQWMIAETRDPHSRDLADWLSSHGLLVPEATVIGVLEALEAAGCLRLAPAGPAVLVVAVYPALRRWLLAPQADAPREVASAA